MGYRIAIATSDGKNVDLHFGSARRFAIYRVDGLKYTLEEQREMPESAEEKPQACGEGCGSGHGCRGGGRHAEAAEMLSDCRSIVCEKIGRSVLKQFETRAISVFEVAIPLV